MNFQCIAFARDGLTWPTISNGILLHHIPILRTSLRTHQLHQRLDLVIPKQLKVILIPSSSIIRLKRQFKGVWCWRLAPPCVDELTCYQHSNKPFDPFFHITPSYHYVFQKFTEISDFWINFDLEQSHNGFI